MDAKAKKQLAQIKRFAKILDKGNDKSYELLEDSEPQQVAWMLNWLIKRLPKEVKHE